MRTTTIIFGHGEAERSYKVTQLPTLMNTRWKERFREPLSEILGILEELQDSFGAGIQLDSTEDLVMVASLLMRKVLMNYVIGGMDMLLDMVIAYSPELEKDREYIEAVAYDEQVAVAFMEILRLAIPFGGDLKAARKVLGFRNAATGMNLPLPSGESANMRRSRKRSPTSPTPTPDASDGKQS